MLAVFNVFVLSLALHLVRGDNCFTSPPSAGVNITEGTQFTVQWTTGWGSVAVSLVVYQQTSSDGLWYYQTLLDGVADPGSFIWTAKPLEGLSTAEGLHFKLSLGDSSNTGTEDTDEYFNSGALFLIDNSAQTTSSETSTSTTSTAQISFETTLSLSAYIFATIDGETSRTSTSATKSASHTTILSLSSLRSQSTSATAATPSRTSSSASHNHDPSAADVSTIVGAVVGVLGFLVAVITLWLTWKRGMYGKWNLPDTFREVNRGLNRRRLANDRV